MPDAAAGERSYGQILKSSAMIGGSSVLNIGFGIIRTKAMALLLGPSGVGLMGLYWSVLDLTQSIAGMGINSAGVRQIAEAVGSGEAERIAGTATVLRKTSIVLGLIGAALLVTLCVPVSTWTFGSGQYAAPVALLSLAVLFRSISTGQEALIHGLRRIGDLARIGVWGGFHGTVLTLAIVYVLRERGIVPSLIAVAAMSLVTSWWFRRKVEIPAATMSTFQVRYEAAALLKLGGAFMGSAILTMGAAYAIRIIVLHNDNLAAAGLYQSAWALGGLYVGVILQAMGSDFYPRLTGVANDNTECNRLVNEQTEIGLLLTGPGVIGTLTFAPLVIALFYSPKFAAAAEPLRWICLGMALRVVTWPMGFIILAKGVQSLFFWTELAATSVHVGLALVAVPRFGVAGAGMAFFGLYVFHGWLIYSVVRRLSGFRWSVASRRLAALILSLIGLVFCGFLVLPMWLATTVGTVAVLANGMYSARVLLSLVPVDRIPGRIRPFVTVRDLTGLNGRE